jgi:hypothetical protein
LCFSFGESLLAETANDDARLLRDRLASCFADLFRFSRLETISYSQFKTLAKKGLLSNVVIGEKLAQLLLEKEVVERPALQSILNAKMTKEARESQHNGRARDYQPRKR